MSIRIRDARPKDARRIAELTTPYAMRRILLHKELIAYFEDIQEFVVAIDEETNAFVGCGALHVMWDDIAEISTPSSFTRGSARRFLKASSHARKSSDSNGSSASPSKSTSSRATASTKSQVLPSAKTLSSKCCVHMTTE